MKPVARLLGALAILSFTALPGCLQFEQGATLMPDGSGKLTLKIAFKKSMIKMMEEMAKSFGGAEGKSTDPFEQMKDIGKLKENGEGFVAWGEPKREEDADWIRMTVSGYFEDINKVKMYNEQDQGGEKKRMLSFSATYEKAGEGGRLKMKNEFGEEFKKMAPPADAGGNEELGKAMIEAMKPMLEGMKIGVAITVPGPVESTGGLPEKKDRTASMGFDGNTLLAVMKDPKGPEAKKLEALGAATDKGEALTWTKTTITADEVEAFKKEMAAAKVSWEKRLKEAEAKKKAGGDK